MELTRCGGFVKRLLPGDIFGENALMGHYDEAASLYTATAVAPTELCFLPIERFEEIVTTHPNLVFTTDTTQWSRARVRDISLYINIYVSHIIQVFTIDFSLMCIGTCCRLPLQRGMRKDQRIMRWT